MTESIRPWQVLSKRAVYTSDWINMLLVDIRMPDGSIWPNIHLVDYHFPAVGAVAIRDDGKILLIEHYRFQTDSVGWEVPAGKIDPGEGPEQAMVRELMEETGHKARSYHRLGKYHPSNGSSNQVFTVYVARGVERVGEIQDTNEVMRLAAFTPEEVRGLVARNEILDGLSLTALCWAISNGEI